jgi:beta-lactamase superfamily II metal-dependent hydrolase
VAHRVAIVTSESGGFGNFPNPETLEALRSAGARTVRTDADGAMTVQGTAGSLVVRTYGASEVVVETGAPRAAAGSVTLNVP